MKKKRSSSLSFSLNPNTVFNELALFALIVFSSVIYSNAQYSEYGDYQSFANLNIDGSGNEEDLSFNNINQPGKQKMKSNS
jgi:hypothetical protein